MTSEGWTIEGEGRAIQLHEQWLGGDVGSRGSDGGYTDAVTAFEIVG